MERNNRIRSDSDSETWINDIRLQIQPENIEISKTGNSIRIPVARTKSSVKIQEGRSDLAIVMTIPFDAGSAFTSKIDNVIYNSLPFPVWNYKLKPLLLQIKKTPLIFVRDKFIGSQIDTKYQSSNGVIPLVVEDLVISTMEGAPYTLAVTMVCSYANLRQFMSDIQFRKIWKYDFN